MYHIVTKMEWVGDEVIHTPIGYTQNSAEINMIEDAYNINIGAFYEKKIMSMDHVKVTTTNIDGMGLVMIKYL